MFAPVWENYMLKSGEGLSLGFILLWMGGDLTNLFGGLLAGLLPTMIILATYVSTLFCEKLVRHRDFSRRKAASSASGHIFWAE